MRFSNWRSALLACLGLLLLAISPLDAGSFPVKNKREYKTLKNQILATQFLTRATFGPTPAEIDSLTARMNQVGYRRAVEEWIDDQFALPATNHASLAETMVNEDPGNFPATESGIAVNRYRHYAWWHIALTADDQLRQRMAWALSQVLPVGDSADNFNSEVADYRGVARWLGLADYYDTLVEHSFGNYRDLLTDVTVHPIMGVWLSHVNNEKANPPQYPDENYAREVEQLFSIGIHKLRMNGKIVKDEFGEPVETYDNDDIKEFARVFTGLTYNNDNATRWRGPLNFSEPMMMVQSRHDEGEKTLLNGTVLPAGQSGMDDINAALDNVFEHSNCPPFISRLLIQRLVRSNPSKAYIRRVARTFVDNGSGARGDLKAVVKAILLDREARQSLVFTKLLDENGKVNGLSVATSGTEFSALREPVLRYTGMFRAFNATNDYPTGRFMIPSQDNDMNQAPYKSPSVFNFYLPDFRPQGDLLTYNPSRAIPNNELYAPEFQILTSVVANRFANQIRSDVIDQKADFTLTSNSKQNPGGGNIQTDIFLDISNEISLASDPAALMQHLDLLLCYGTMLDSSRDMIAQVLSEETTNAELRAESAIIAVLTMPEAAVAD